MKTRRKSSARSEPIENSPDSIDRETGGEMILEGPTERGIKRKDLPRSDLNSARIRQERTTDTDEDIKEEEDLVIRRVTRKRSVDVKGDEELLPKSGVKEKVIRGRPSVGKRIRYEETADDEVNGRRPSSSNELSNGRGLDEEPDPVMDSLLRQVTGRRVSRSNAPSNVRTREADVASNIRGLAREADVASNGRGLDEEPDPVMDSLLRQVPGRRVSRSNAPPNVRTREVDKTYGGDGKEARSGSVPAIRFGAYEGTGSIPAIHPLRAPADGGSVPAIRFGAYEGTGSIPAIHPLRAPADGGSASAISIAAATGLSVTSFKDVHREQPELEMSDSIRGEYSGDRQAHWTKLAQTWTGAVMSLTASVYLVGVAGFYFVPDSLNLRLYALTLVVLGAGMVSYSLDSPVSIYNAEKKSVLEVIPSKSVSATESESVFESVSETESSQVVLGKSSSAFGTAYERISKFLVCLANNPVVVIAVGVALCFWRRCLQLLMLFSTVVYIFWVNIEVVLVVSLVLGAVGYGAFTYWKHSKLQDELVKEVARQTLSYLKVETSDYVGIDFVEEHMAEEISVQAKEQQRQAGSAAMSACMLVGHEFIPVELVEYFLDPAVVKGLWPKVRAAVKKDRRVQENSVILEGRRRDCWKFIGIRTIRKASTGALSQSELASPRTLAPALEAVVSPPAPPAPAAPAAPAATGSKASAAPYSANSSEPDVWVNGVVGRNPSTPIAAGGGLRRSNSYSQLVSQGSGSGIPVLRRQPFAINNQ